MRLPSLLSFGLGTDSNVERREQTGRTKRSAIERRKGGGGKGGGGGGSKGGGSKGGGSSGGGSKGSGGKTSASGGSTTRSKFSIPGISSKRSVTPFSSGGGKPTSIKSGSTFSGRQIGGGNRGEVYGSTRYGSGYPYGGYGSYVAGRGFPFGFWPIYWGPHYYGGGEYGPEKNNSRPGGNMTTVRVQSSFWKNVSNIATRDDSNTTAPLLNVFNLVGDEDSLRAVLDVLASSNCDVSNLTIVAYDLTNTSQPQPESVVQYYRASSFALTLDGYNNTAASVANMPTDNSTAPPNVADSPIPTNHTDMNFLSCINGTIGDSVPLLDGALPKLAQSPVGGLVGLSWLIFFSVRSLL